jgi:hypothetical protein
LSSEKTFVESQVTSLYNTSSVEVDSQVNGLKDSLDSSIKSKQADLSSDRSEMNGLFLKKFINL